MLQAIQNFFKPIDLTKGKPWKVILIFAIPILISTILNSAFSLINALVLKVNVGGDSVTAINSTSPISSILFNFAYGCSSGFAVIASNQHGAKDDEGVKKSFYHSIFLSLVLALIIMAIGLIFYKDLLKLLNINERYLTKAGNYYQIILCSFIFMMLSNFLGNFLRAIGNSSIPLIISLGATLVNIGMAFLLTGPIHLDTRGVALATLSANLFNTSITLFYIYKKYPFLRLKKEDLKMEKSMIGSLLKMGLPLGLQWSILFVGSFIQAQKVNGFGDLATKAVSCYSPMEGYLTIPLSVMASSLLSYVGQNYGAKEKQRIKNGIRDVFIIDMICYALIVIIGFIIIPNVPYIFLPKNELAGEEGSKIMYYCSTYLKILIPFLIMQGIVQMSRSCLQGIKKPIIPFLSGIGELVARVVICLFIPGWINPSNPTSNESYLGICFSTPIAWVVSALIMGGSVIYIIFIQNLRSLDQITDIEKEA